MKKLMYSLVVLFLMGTTMASFTSCRETKKESTEDKIEKAADDVGDAAEDVADDVEDAVDDNN